MGEPLCLAKAFPEAGECFPRVRKLFTHNFLPHFRWQGKYHSWGQGNSSHAEGEVVISFPGEGKWMFWKKTIFIWGNDSLGKEKCFHYGPNDHPFRRNVIFERKIFLRFNKSCGCFIPS